MVLCARFFSLRFLSTSWHPLRGPRTLRHTRSPDHPCLPSTGLHFPPTFASRLMQLPNPLLDLHDCRVLRACRLYGRDRATPLLRHQTLAQPPLRITVFIAVRLLPVALPQAQDTPPCLGTSKPPPAVSYQRTWLLHLPGRPLPHLLTSICRSHPRTPLTGAPS